MSNAGSSFGNGGRASVRRLSLLDGLRCAATGQPRAAQPRLCALMALASEKRIRLDDAERGAGRSSAGANGMDRKYARNRIRKTPFRRQVLGDNPPVRAPRRGCAAARSA